MYSAYVLVISITLPPSQKKKALNKQFIDDDDGVS